jgi:uncharacterized protein YjiS (DUF1127 family)
MNATTRTASKIANSLRREFLGKMQSQQTRSVGNLPVKSNKYIEDFGARRETIEKEFAWDGPTLRRIALWGVLVPYGIYQMVVYESNRTDEFGKKPKRDMWGSSA